MSLFKSELIRSFGIGFALGAMVIWAVMAGSDGGVRAGMVPSAQAAQPDPMR